MVNETTYLPAGLVLTVTADASSAGHVTQLGHRPGDNQVDRTSVSASSSALFGPFGYSTRWSTDSTSGLMTYSIAADTRISPSELNVLDGLTKTTAQLNALVVGVAGGYKLARSAAPVALDGSNPTTVATGLTTVIAGGACLSGTAAPGLSTCALSVAISSTNLDIYGWKPTGAADCALIASGGTELLHWWAIRT
jgi:hypothetical protein